MYLTVSIRGNLQLIKNQIKIVEYSASPDIMHLILRARVHLSERENAIRNLLLSGQNKTHTKNHYDFVEVIDSKLFKVFDSNLIKKDIISYKRTEKICKYLKTKYFSDYVNWEILNRSMNIYLEKGNNFKYADLKYRLVDGKYILNSGIIYIENKDKLTIEVYNGYITKL